MTTKLKGRTENTPVRLAAQQGEATFLRDECEEQLQRLADQAEDFEISLLSETRTWSSCCERIDAWGREAAESERIYGDGLRDLLRDKVAMEEQGKKDRPVFDFQHRRLSGAIDRIYEFVAASLPPPPVQRVAGRIIYGTDALELAIRKRKESHRREISRARKAPFRDFYAWRSQIVRANTELESKRRDNQSVRGPLPKEQRHRAIARKVAEFQRRYREGWRKKEN